MKLLIVVLLVALIGACEARLPAVGDHVNVDIDQSYYQGVIVDMDPHFICINASYLAAEVPIEHGYSAYEPINVTNPFDICLAINEIKKLSWFMPVA